MILAIFTLTSRFRQHNLRPKSKSCCPPWVIPSPAWSCGASWVLWVSLLAGYRN